MTNQLFLKTKKMLQFDQSTSNEKQDGMEQLNADVEVL
jgi:hypothetical protein